MVWIRTEVVTYEGETEGKDLGKAEHRTFSGLVNLDSLQTIVGPQSLKHSDIFREGSKWEIVGLVDHSTGNLERNDSLVIQLKKKDKWEEVARIKPSGLQVRLFLGSEDDAMDFRMRLENMLGYSLEQQRKPPENDPPLRRLNPAVAGIGTS